MRMASVSNLLSKETYLWIFSLTLQFKVIAATTPNINANNNLQLGEELLSKGRFSDALSQFHVAIEADPSYYLSYYRRATTYITLAKSKSAVRDLNRVIDLKPDFLLARIQRGSIFIKEGKLEEALIDFESVLRQDPNNQDALRFCNIIKTLNEEIRFARRLMTLGKDVHFYEAIIILDKVLKQCPWNPALHELRAECYILLGDKVKAINDFKIITHLRRDNADAYYDLSVLYYELGEAEEALSEVRECLKLDPEQEDCGILYKKVKKLAAQIKLIKKFIAENRYKECVEKSKQMLEFENQTHAYIFRAKAFQCHCHLRRGESNKALSACSEALSTQESWPVLCDRAEAYVAFELYDEAIQDYNRALEFDENLKRAEEGLDKAQKLLKRDQTRASDYYRLLRVRRTADRDTISKAYRKLAHKWHPDKFQGEFRKIAAKKFIDIAAAKEVLTDPEKRKQYDNMNSFP